VADSFPSAQQKIREYAGTLKRPFTASYNPYTQTIQILDTKEKILRYASNIGNDIQVLVGALGQLQ
jgi:phenylalanine-4-hydroxylase